jgi:two-component system cell cycle response regulator
MKQIRIVLIESDEGQANMLSRRLRAQGYIVDVATDPIEGATLALAEPPTVLVAELWMPGISGVQLCRLLQSEASTAHVPVILSGPGDVPKNSFWAEQAGAIDYVPSGRVGALVRAIERAVERAQQEDVFFTYLGDGCVDIRERIASLLDDALFESVLASEVRALGACGSFERLFDLFSQLAARITAYRWIALRTDSPRRFAIHTNPLNRTEDLETARSVLSTGVDEGTFILIEDGDAIDIDAQFVAHEKIEFGHLNIGALAIAFEECDDEGRHLAGFFARELGGPLRMVSLVEESRRLATTDPLTGLANRRAFLGEFKTLLHERRSGKDGVCALMLDVDHFKQINDNFGHAAGDLVLATLGGVLEGFAPSIGSSARWGGEEFVVSLDQVDYAHAVRLAEELCATIAALEIEHDATRIPITASIGVAAHRVGDDIESLIDRADRAMYLAKTSGRNRVCTEDMLTREDITPPREEALSSA